MEYTQEMFKEDLRIAKNTLKKKFSEVVDYDEQQDFIQMMLIDLCFARGKYDPSKCKKYTNYAIHICRVAIYEYYHINNYNKRKINNDTISINSEIKENYTIEDTLSSSVNVEKDFEYKELITILNNLIDRQKSKALKKVAKLFIKGYQKIDISFALGVSRQYSDKYVELFKTLARQELNKINYFN